MNDRMYELINQCFIGTTDGQQGVSENPVPPNITIQQVVPGRNAQLSILVDGGKKFSAAKTQGPGTWFVYPEGSSESIGMASNRKELKAIVLSYLSNQGAAEETFRKKNV